MATMAHLTEPLADNMRIIERTKIGRPAMKVWSYVIKPAYFQKWNKNIVSMEARDEFRIGQPFTTHYKLGKKQTQCISVVMSIIEGSLLELHHSNCVGTDGSSEMEVCERIVLKEHNGKTTVIKEVSVKNHGIPWILVAIIWFVTRFGRPTEPDRLKVMCESDS
jgi:hypothetical protein